MADRLVSVHPLIKAHPLWSGSMEEMAFNFGGVTESHVRDLLARLDRCDDLTARERVWRDLWRDALGG